MKCEFCGYQHDLEDKYGCPACEGGTLVIGAAEVPTEIRFMLDGEPEPVLTLNYDGFHYKGQRVDDSGRAYELFIDYMSNAMGEETLQ